MTKKTGTAQCDAILSELIRCSNTTGKDTALVQGGGGNTSAKTPDGKYMYLKASGTALKDMDINKGWRRLKLDDVLSILKDGRLAKMDTTARENEIVKRLLLACHDDMPPTTRPSVEAHLHAILDSYIIHLHPPVVGAYVNTIDGQKRVARMFANEKYPPLWVPYTDPGFSLARETARLVAQYKKLYNRGPAIIFMDKHGLFISAGSADTALRLVRKVIKRCGDGLPAVKKVKIKPVDKQAVFAAKLAIRKAVFQCTGQYRLVSFTLNDTVAAFLARKDAAKLLAAGSLTPDEMVYAGGAACWLDKYDHNTIIDKLQKRIDAGNKPYSAFLIKSLGLFVAGDVKTIPVVETVAADSMYIRTCAHTFGGIRPLNKRQQNFINKWEAESYRHQQFSGAASGDLMDKIAVVTGAGSGLGRGIAIGLARAGANVAICDIDIQGAQETAELIQKELPQAQTLAIAGNVTDENSVDYTFNTILERWGGLDILVNAAGVAPAYSLVDLPVDKWRFALEVNLTGYFLMARAAARVMIAQRLGGSIINLSSKSGLDASKNNTPYNATKAGELHMARGWAMELGEHGIRVNCVCPGNVFEGSKIWNPEYIKTCAKKYGIKPEEVIPYYVNKTILKRQITRQDIADSIIFLCSDKSRTITGQTIVADGGQVMVR